MNNNSSKINIRAIARKTMRLYGFLPDFSSAVIEEVEALGPLNLSGEKFFPAENIKDLSHLLWSSIDNEDSKDLDQLEYCERRPNGEIRVMIAIADVDEYVSKNSSCDRHARHNGTSVYTGVEVFCMLPTRLSWDLTSLNPGEKRLAIVMDFFVRADGSVRFHEIFRAVVVNKAKLVYESIGDWLEEKVATPKEIENIPGLEDQMSLQAEAADRLYRLRSKNGSLELDTIEASAVMKDGEVSDLLVKNKNRARMIIENFMVASNSTMVWFLERNRLPLIQRIVRTPEKWPRIVRLAGELGETLSPEPDPLALADFLKKQRVKAPLLFPDLSLAIVKLIGAGEYVLAERGKSSPGHFGLAVQDYTHASAPNRRYVDVIIQRLVKSVLAKKDIPYTKSELNELAQWCTDRDKSSKKVERFMRKAAGCVLLANRLGEIFTAIVTGASEKGTYARLLSPAVEGRIIRNEQGLEVADKVQVRLLALDAERGYIDFETVSRK